LLSKETKKQAAEQKKSADAAEKAKAADIKKDKAAEKAANTLADKLLKVVKAAEKEMEKYHPMVGTNEYLILQERKVYDMLEDARIRSDISIKEASWV
jgi:membrane protein involved in colicin uptake